MRIRWGLLLGCVVLAVGGCVGGSRGTGVKTFEPRPEDDDARFTFPWEVSEPCDLARDEGCRAKSQQRAQPLVGSDEHR